MNRPPRRESGMHIALMGIDGIGKTTLARELVAACRAAGYPVRLVTWRDTIEHAADRAAFPVPSLRNLWFETFRLYYGGAMADGGRTPFPRSYEELVERGGLDHLGDAKISGVRASGPFTAAMLELVGQVLIHHEVIQPMLDRGHYVFQESFGIKHVMKELMASVHLDPSWRPYAADVMAFARRIFGTMLAPDLGIYVAGDPSMARRWRMGELGRLGVFETLSVAGADPVESFVTVQRESILEFERFAEEYGWFRLDVVDAPREVNRARAFEALSGTVLGPVLAAAVRAADGRGAGVQAAGGHDGGLTSSPP